MAFILKSSGEKVEVVPRNGEWFDLDELQAHVGGYVQVINLPDGNKMFVNEEGRLRELPRNYKATHLAFGPEPVQSRDGVIVGDVLVTNAVEAGEPSILP